jgi:hypothetical protein
MVAQRWVLTLVASTFLAAAAPAFAQTKGRIGVGASLTHNITTDDDVSSVTTYGPLVRLNPRKGFRVAGALNWFRADLEDPNGVSALGDFARLRARPLMGGVSYTVGSQERVLTSFSIVGGPSFNKAEFEPGRAVAGESIDADNSVAIRPGVGVTWTLAERVAFVGFGGYLINRPDVTYRDRFGREFTNLWKADAVVLSVGVVYSIF